MIRHFYAAQEPRGFANESNVHQFDSRAERDKWVEEHLDDNYGQANTRVVTARLARSYLLRKDEFNKLFTPADRERNAARTY